MNIKTHFTSTSQFSAQASEVTRNAGIWIGTHASAGYHRYLLPTSSKIQSVALYALQALGKFLEKGPTPVLTLAGSLFFVGIVAFKVADKKAYEDNTLLKGIWKTLGVTSFIFATAATTCAIVVLLG